MMTQDELKTILDLHSKWFKNEDGGKQANLGGANLYGANLGGANLSGANLYGADLSGADLSEANLYGANLRGADLRRADLRRADLSGADLRGADLRDANLPRFQICSETGSFRCFKKVIVNEVDKVVIELEVPASAKRTSSLVGRKCRASAVNVIRAFGTEETLFTSIHDRRFVYEVGKTVEVKDFDGDVRIECTKGVHFFVTRQEAEEFEM